MRRFPACFKAPYTRRCSDDTYFTDSVDLLLPGVGEILGGSLTVNDPDELEAAIRRQGLDPEGYRWGEGDEGHHGIYL